MAELDVQPYFLPSLKLYICRVCLHSFRRKFNVTQRHIRAVHPVIPSLCYLNFYSDAQFGTGDNTEMLELGEDIHRPI